METANNVASNFSIDHILNRAGQKTCKTIYSDEYFTPNFELQTGGDSGGNFDFPRSQNTMATQRECFQQYTFQWLNCTRYHPPKLPRNQRKDIIKRQPGRHPRIPFTPLQIDTLENSYKICPYLNNEEIIRLSRILNLPDSRIKIWFQNRRAREKREASGNDNSYTSN